MIDHLIAAPPRAKTPFGYWALSQIRHVSTEGHSDGLYYRLHFAHSTFAVREDELDPVDLALLQRKIPRPQPGDR